MDTKEFDSALAMINPTIKEFEKGELIYSPDNFENNIGFVMGGECRVCKKRPDGTVIPLNILSAEASFGILTVLSKKAEFPTYVYAAKKSCILFIDSSDFLNLIKNSTSVSRNIIDFLTNKIIFLNEKIDTFSCGSAEEKIANHLLFLSRKYKTLEFAFNKKQSAESIGIGRASLYRGMEQLREIGLITFDSKKII